MNPEIENFEQLRRLLAVKRHEQPPPGYFNTFSSQVISRIKAGELGEPDSLVERLLRDAPWLGRLWYALEAKPAFAGAFGAAVCALLISGILYAESGESPSVLPAFAAEMMPSVDTSSALAMNDSLDRAQATSSTNPVAPVPGSLFEQIQLPSTQPVSYPSLSGH
jgi:hypothetical protein